MKKGDLVASHWGVAVMRISASQAKKDGKMHGAEITAANGC